MSYISIYNCFMAITAWFVFKHRSGIAIFHLAVKATHMRFACQPGGFSALRQTLSEALAVESLITDTKWGLRLP
jgi:hypothetical protein